jgi:hypothetical protein
VIKRTKRFLDSLLDWGWDYTKKKPITSYNPTRVDAKAEHITPVYTLYHYSENDIS